MSQEGARTMDHSSFDRNTSLLSLSLSLDHMLRVPTCGSELVDHPSRVFGLPPKRRSTVDEKSTSVLQRREPRASYAGNRQHHQDVWRAPSPEQDTSSRRAIAQGPSSNAFRTIDAQSRSQAT